MGACYHYTTYGLVIRSCLRLPELVECSPISNPDVIITREGVDLPLPERSPDGRYLSADHDHAFFYWPDAGRFLIREGREVVFDLLDGVAEDIARLAILGPVLATLLHQRGYLVLHASCIEINGSGQAIAFMGHSGWGKSTVAAALGQLGHRLVADDLTAILIEQDQPIVTPGFPLMRLWPESLKALGEDPESLQRVHIAVEKRAYPAGASYRIEPLPLSGVYVLDRGDLSSIEPLRRQEALVELVRHSFTVRLLQPSGTAGRHFTQCSALVKAVPVRRLCRPADLSLLHDVAGKVIEDSSKLPAFPQYQRAK